MQGVKFIDRKEAGQLLAQKLLDYKLPNTLVLAVPRGGVPIGHEIANVLGCELDVILAKKIGHPTNPEFAIGAVAQDAVIINDDLEIPSEYLDKAIYEIKTLLEIKRSLYRSKKSNLQLNNKVVILVDDGIATGNTIKVLIQLIRKLNPEKLIVASPVVPNSQVEIIRKLADEFIYLIASNNFDSVSSFYHTFKQIEDKEVISILSKR